MWEGEQKLRLLVPDLKLIDKITWMKGPDATGTGLQYSIITVITLYQIPHLLGWDKDLDNLKKGVATERTPFYKCHLNILRIAFCIL